MRVKAGTKVLFVNHDDIPHLVVLDNGKVRSRALDTDDSFTFIFDKPGEFVYFCGRGRRGESGRQGRPHQPRLEKLVSRQSARNSSMFNAAMRSVSALRFSAADWDIGRRSEKRARMASGSDRRRRLFDNPIE